MREFIDQIKELIDSKAETVEFIAKPDLLIKSLEELNGLTGMEKAKGIIVGQVKFLISQMSNYNKSSDKEDIPLSKMLEGHMLHTVIYGPPGVGKTRLGVILSKIWNSLGILKGASNENKDKIVTSDSISIDFFDNYQKLSNSLSKVYTASHQDDEKIIDAGYYASILAQKFVILKQYCEVLEDYREDKSKDDETIKIISASDLISKWVGDTALKTRQVLESCTGKVLFIDEAYSLYPAKDKGSYFGLDCLTEINRYMSEHPDRVIVILAGYKEDMEEGIFKAQPGLKRRCTWFIDIEGYTPKDLEEIFKTQLKRSNWELESGVNVSDVFIRNKGLFDAYGGDTEKLAYYCKLAYAESEFLSNLSKNKTETSNTQPSDGKISKNTRSKTKRRRNKTINKLTPRKINNTMLNMALMMYKENKLKPTESKTMLSMYM